MEIKIKRNDKGIYAEVSGKFALVDRRYLDRVEEGEKWIGRVVKEITDRRGNKVPIVVPEKRLLKISEDRDRDFEEAVFSGDRRLFSLKEGVKKGAVEFVSEEKIYDWRPGYRKEVYRIIPSPYGVPDPKGLTEYDKWPYVEPQRLSEILEEKKYLRERFKEQAEKGREIKKKLWQIEKEIDQKEKEIECIKCHPVEIDVKEGTYNGKTVYREVTEIVGGGYDGTDYFLGYGKDIEVETRRVPVEVHEEKLREYRRLWEEEKRRTEEKLKTLEKEIKELEKEYKQIEEENKDLLVIYKLYREATLDYNPETERNYTFTDDWFVLPEYLYRAVGKAENTDDEEVLEKVEEVLGKTPETPQGLAFGLAVVGELYGIKPESLDIEQFKDCYFEGPEDAGEAFLEEVEKLWKEKVEPKLGNGIGIDF